MLSTRPNTPPRATKATLRRGLPAIALSATLSLSLGAAGCGGGGHSTTATTAAAPNITKAEFIAKANAICASADPNLASENAKLASGHPSPAAVVAAVKSVYLPSVEAQVTSIKALGTPSGDQATVTRMLQLVEGDLSKVRANPALITTDVFGDFARVAHPYGLTACAPLS